MRTQTYPPVRSSFPCLFGEADKRYQDWIAHGILDSVVDSFFPFVAQVDKEVAQVDKFLYSNPDDSEPAAKAGSNKPRPSSDSTLDAVDEKNKDDGTSTSADDEKPLSPVRPQRQVKTAMFRASPLPISLYFRRARRFIKSRLFKTSTGTGIGEPWIPQQANPATRTVYRMAKIRKLVTSLTRLLSTKADLIRQIRKRLVPREEWSLDSDPELYIHLGDILGQSPAYESECYSDRGHPRPYLVSAAGSRSLRTDVGPVTPDLPHSAAYPGRQDQRKQRQRHHRLDGRQYWGS